LIVLTFREENEERGKKKWVRCQIAGRKKKRIRGTRHFNYEGKKRKKKKKSSKKGGGKCSDHRRVEERRRGCATFRHGKGKSYRKKESLVAGLP